MNTYEDPEAEYAEGEGPSQYFHIIVNGKNMEEKSTVTMQGWRCADNICPNEYGLKECSSTTRNWSDPASWSSGVVPVEGDFVEVETGWNMIYDIEGDSPLFEMVTIEGCLTFYQPEEGEVFMHLRTKHV